MALTRLIYVVDDSADYRFLLQQLFSRFLPAYPVRFFASGQALLEELTDSRPHPGLIVLDRHMPGLDGHQTLQRLKQHPDHRIIPVVMMSADASSSEIEDCYQAGVNSFLFKPIDGESLRASLSLICQYWLELNLAAVER